MVEMMRSKGWKWLASHVQPDPFTNTSHSLTPRSLHGQYPLIITRNAGKSKEYPPLCLCVSQWNSLLLQLLLSTETFMVQHTGCRHESGAGASLNVNQGQDELTPQASSNETVNQLVIKWKNQWTCLIIDCLSNWLSKTVSIYLPFLSFSNSYGIWCFSPTRYTEMLNVLGVWSVRKNNKFYQF